MKEDKDGSREQVPDPTSFGSTRSMMMTCLELVRAVNIDNDWRTQMDASSKFKILFKNGYYDFQTRAFHAGLNHPHIRFSRSIPHDYEAETCPEEAALIDSIRQRFFRQTLETDAGDCFIRLLGRGLAGDTSMKRMVLGLGSANAGKSKLTEAIKNAIREYFGSYSAENLTLKKAPDDPEKAFGWMLKVSDCRLVFSNELRPGEKLNGTIIKNMVGNGDQHQGRELYGKPTTFVTQFLPVLFANDMNEIAGYDRAVDNRLVVFSYSKTFVDRPAEPDELLKDPGIDQEIQTLAFRKAMAKLLIQGYDESDRDGIAVPESSEQAKSMWIDRSQVNILECFTSDFGVCEQSATVDVGEMCVRVADINAWLKEATQGRVSSRKLLSEVLKKYPAAKFPNLKTGQKRIDSKTAQVWFGIAAKQDPPVCAMDPDEAG